MAMHSRFLDPEGRVRARLQRWTGLAAVGSALLAWSPYLCATTYNVNVTIDPSAPGLSGPVILAFDYNDGGPPDNTVVLSPLVFSADWTPNGDPNDSLTGGVCGVDPSCPPPWTFTESMPPNSFYELQVPFSTIGTTLSFSFTTTDNAPEGPFPDSFSFFMLDPDTGLPLFPTTDPIFGDDAMFLVSIAGIGPCEESLCAFAPDPAIPGFFMTVTPVSVPEPGTLALLAAGFVAIFARRRLS